MEEELVLFVIKVLIAPVHYDLMFSVGLFLFSYLSIFSYSHLLYPLSLSHLSQSVLLGGTPALSGPTIIFKQIYCYAYTLGVKSTTILQIDSLAPELHVEALYIDVL